MDNKNFPAPADMTAAMHKLITSTPGGYEAMAQQLSHDGTHNALSNRVRQIGGQMVPFGMVIQMEAFSCRTDITEAMCKRAGGVFVKLPDVDQVGNEELLHKFNDLLAALGDFSRAHNEFTNDGVLDREESKRLRAKGYSISFLPLLNLIDRVSIDFRITTSCMGANLLTKHVGATSLMDSNKRFIVR